MSKILSKGLTFDDVLLVPAYSEVTPDMVDVTAWLTPSISLNIPLVSAAMDTVTESAMAISLARAGGIGIVHKNMSIERQKLEIEKVKKSESGMIIDPITVEPDGTVTVETVTLEKDDEGHVTGYTKTTETTGSVTDETVEPEVPDQATVGKDGDTTYSFELPEKPEITTPVQRDEAGKPVSGEEVLPLIDTSGNVIGYTKVTYTEGKPSYSDPVLGAYYATTTKIETLAVHHQDPRHRHQSAGRSPVRLRRNMVFERLDEECGGRSEQW